MHQRTFNYIISILFEILIFRYIFPRKKNLHRQHTAQNRYWKTKIEIAKQKFTRTPKKKQKNIANITMTYLNMLRISQIA